MLSFEMQFDGRPDIENLKRGFEKWMSAIEIEVEKYDVKILPGFDREPNIGRLEVTYEGNRLFDVYFYRKYLRTENGKKSICSMSELTGDRFLSGQSMTQDERWNTYGSW